MIKVFGILWSISAGEMDSSKAARRRRSPGRWRVIRFTVMYWAIFHLKDGGRLMGDLGVLED
jgi:hypothetical protein